MAILESRRRWLEIVVMMLAAALEVGGDALLRAGLRGSGFFLVVGGFFVLGSYGVAVNLLAMDFSKLLGTYVAFFALASVLFISAAPGNVISVLNPVGDAAQ